MAYAGRAGTWSEEKRCPPGSAVYIMIVYHVNSSKPALVHGGSKLAGVTFRCYSRVEGYVYGSETQELPFIHEQWANKQFHR